MAHNNEGDLERFFSLYESKNNNFLKVFGIMVGIGLFFLLTVVLPYFLNIYEYDQNKMQILIENKSVQDNNVSIQILNKRINETKEDITTLSNRIEDTQLTMNTKINTVNNLLSDADRLLANVSDPSTLVTLKDVFNKTQYKKNATIQLAATVLQSYNNSISVYDERIDKHNRGLNTSISAIKVSLSKLENATAKKNLLIDRLTNLTERWKEIQSPFGNLPIDFTNLLAVFPIGLSAGFLLCSKWLSESIRLRIFLHNLRDVKKSKQEKFKDDRLCIIAPLWIDPSNPDQNKTMQYLLLSIPLVIFILSVLIISYAWENAPSSPFPAASDVNKNIYYGLYAGGIGIFIYGFWRIIREVRHYNKFIKI